jgi:predicted helicase
MRRSLAEEFTNIYVVHLRGDIRKNMLSKGAAKEGGNVFDSGCMTGIAMTFLVKNPSAKSHGNIYFHDIGDDLSGEKKRNLIAEFKGIGGISTGKRWEKISPDKHNDWLNQRDESFDHFIKIGDKKDKQDGGVFNNYALGVSTNRDTWCYNFSKDKVNQNISSMIDFFNEEINRYKTQTLGISEFISNDAEKISWSRSLKNDLKNHRKLKLSEDSFVKSAYRPFQKQWMYFNRRLNEAIGLMPQLFPSTGVENRIICITGVGARAGFSVFALDAVTNLHTLDSGQCFPLYLYEKADDNKDDLFGDAVSDDYTRKDGISDAGLAHFVEKYPTETISKEDLFYYIYGLLHSPEYRTRYADNLTKELPRIPPVNKTVDFWAFSKAGRDLAELHLNYETVEKYPVKFDTGKTSMGSLSASDYYVTKMKFAKVKDPDTEKRVNDKTTVIYNERIIIQDIPLKAYDYVVNGKPALEWVMDRQAVTTDKNSGIVNDANLWATETMNNAKYPLELFQRVITVSLETMKIVNNLPKLDID